MPAFVTFGRILFAVLFIYTGATKFFPIQATADFIATKVVVPDVIAPYTKQIETATAHDHAATAGDRGRRARDHCGADDRAEFRRALLRMLMIIYMRGSTVLFYDFWNQAAPDNAKMLVDALKNLSIIGALFMIMGYGRATRSAETAYGDV